MKINPLNDTENGHTFDVLAPLESFNTALHSDN